MSLELIVCPIPLQGGLYITHKMEGTFKENTPIVRVIIKQRRLSEASRKGKPYRITAMAILDWEKGCICIYVTFGVVVAMVIFIDFHNAPKFNKNRNAVIHTSESQLKNWKIFIDKEYFIYPSNTIHILYTLFLAQLTRNHTLNISNFI